MRGVVVAPVTPMNKDLSVDLVGLRELTRYLVKSGVTGFTACAVTAETETLSVDEHRAVLRAVVEAADHQVPVYCGIGRGSLLETRGLVGFVESIGGDGLFVITPYASAYSLDEVSAYFRDVAGRTTLPVMLYNCPGYSGVNIPPSTVAELASIENILSIKEGEQSQLQADLASVEKTGFDVFTARDSYLLESLSAGAAGVISFAANVAPTLLVALDNAWSEGRAREAQDLHERVVALVRILVTRSYPLFIKAAMNEIGLPAGPCRRIELSLTDEERVTMSGAIEAVQPTVV
ncbi:MAG: dihydrodipicolinate synthase family protein [Candidatus Dormiibacterota bacterium]